MPGAIDGTRRALFAGPANPRQGDPMSEASATFVPTTGRVGETRSIGLSMLWFVLTLGLYGLYWAYKTHEEMHGYSGEGIGGVLGLVIWIVIGIVSLFVIPSEVGKLYRKDGQQPPVTGITGLWTLIPLLGGIIWFVKVQGALNRFWESKGARA
jgi:amino acid transporter